MNSKEQILELVKDGTITVEEGLKLLNAMEGPAKNETTQATAYKPANTKRMVRILVNSDKGENVRVNIPLALVKVGMDIGSKMKIDGKAVDLKGIDFDDIIQMIDEGATGELVSVDSDNGDKVRIFVDQRSWGNAVSVACQRGQADPEPVISVVVLNALQAHDRIAVYERAKTTLNADQA